MAFCFLIPLPSQIHFARRWRSRGTLGEKITKVSLTRISNILMYGRSSSFRRSWSRFIFLFSESGWCAFTTNRLDLDRSRCGGTNNDPVDYSMGNWEVPINTWDRGVGARKFSYTYRITHPAQHRSNYGIQEAQRSRPASRKQNPPR